MVLVLRRSATGAMALALALALIAVMGCVGVMGVEMSEPGTLVAVENGTEEAVVFDCPFTLDEGDRFEDLVIKWYYKEEPQPIYQWIPATSMPPQALGRFVDVVDEGYRVEGVAEGESSAKAHMHRALRLLNPTTDLTGKYRCQVSSFNNYRTMLHELVVYRKPEEVSLYIKKVEVDEEDGKVKAAEVMCLVSDTYPQPTITLSHNLVDGGNTQEMQRLRRRFSSGQGSYSLQVWGNVLDRDLAGLTEFHCHVTFNKTNIGFTQHAEYQPSVEERTQAVTARGGSDIITASLANLVLMFLVLGSL